MAQSAVALPPPTTTARRPVTPAPRTPLDPRSEPAKDPGMSTVFVTTAYGGPENQQFIEREAPAPRHGEIGRAHV